MHCAQIGNFSSTQSLREINSKKSSKTTIFAVAEVLNCIFYFWANFSPQKIALYLGIILTSEPQNKSKWQFLEFLEYQKMISRKI